MTRFIIVGPGRAGSALALALRRAGHEISAVVGRSPGSAERLVGRVGGRGIRLGEALPATDLLLLTVRDDAIDEVADALAESDPEAEGAVHVSGLKPVGALTPLKNAGLAIGSWHPLQTFPHPDEAPERLRGAWMAVTSESEQLARLLERVSIDLGARPFRLADELKPVYHASAAAAANYVTTALSLAEALARAAGVPFEAANPLVLAVVDNVFRLGAKAALTGPIARAERSTVATQLEAIERQVPELEEDFRAFGRATARLAGTLDTFEDLL